MHCEIHIKIKNKIDQKQTVRIRKWVRTQQLKFKISSNRIQKNLTTTSCLDKTLTCRKVASRSCRVSRLTTVMSRCPKVPTVPETTRLSLFPYLRCNSTKAISSCSRKAILLFSPIHDRLAQIWGARKLFQTSKAVSFKLQPAAKSLFHQRT